MRPNKNNHLGHFFRGYYRVFGIKVWLMFFLLNLYKKNIFFIFIKYSYILKKLYLKKIQPHIQENI